MEYMKNDELRKNNKKIINNVLKSKKLADTIEISILNYANSFCKDNDLDEETCEYIYNEKTEQIIDVIKININEFKKNIKNKKINPTEIAFLSPQELDPSKWKKELEKRKKARKNLQEANITTEYTCSKCKCKKHTVVSLQTRSADEPITHFITCTNCGNTFKQ
jgi:DNA-directed RNA polymerase subunit M/transcription elongation factor TFIIS